ncbi:MAG: DUF2608 domain-containing protein [Alphaproteobacteria bacterium]
MLASACSHDPIKIGDIQEISSVEQMKPFLRRLDHTSLVVFDVDFVILMPVDKIGLPESKPIRQKIFKHYVPKLGKAQAKNLFVTFNKLVQRKLVEPETANIIRDLHQRQIPTIALSALSMKPLGPVKDPMSFRLAGLRQHGIWFTDSLEGKQVTWSQDSGYQAGVILSGAQIKGDALEHYLDNIAKSHPSTVVFIDDRLDWLHSVQQMCDKKGIAFKGFHYSAEVLKGNVADPEMAWEQFKVLHGKGAWIPDAVFLKR